MTLEKGMKNSVKTLVCAANTARTMGSGELEVFATPAMAALMERAASELCSRHCDAGSTTVGTVLEISHLAPTPVGACVRAEAVVTQLDGRKISFDVSAYDESGLIGRGRHERAVVFSEGFLQKAIGRINTGEKDNEQ